MIRYISLSSMNSCCAWICVYVYRISLKGINASIFSLSRLLALSCHLITISNSFGARCSSESQKEQASRVVFFSISLAHHCSTVVSGRMYKQYFRFHRNLFCICARSASYGGMRVITCSLLEEGRRDALPCLMKKQKFGMKLH